MTISITTQASEMPETLPDHDFGFAIDYKKGEGPAKRVFGAMHRFIEACEACTQSLVDSIGVSIDPVIVLEDLEAGSIRSWFRTIWNEDGLHEATKSGDFKQAVGTVIASVVDKMVNKTNDPDSPPKLHDIQSDICKLVENVDVKGLAVRKKIPGEDIIEVVKKFESIKELLLPEDRAEFLLSEEIRTEFVQSFKVNIGKLEKEATKEEVINRNQVMILVVKKPDYLGASQWDFKYSGRSITAAIEDKNWVADFQTRKIDVRPGDALKCGVRIETAYGYSNNVISQKHYVEKVEEVIEKGDMDLPQMWD
ncbi:MAG: hypothetical protein F4221_10145 [Rhodothermaceae bacterium]|nr:hypothetical protein [Rhodothermaceae bacterium]